MLEWYHTGVWQSLNVLPCTTFLPPSSRRPLRKPRKVELRTVSSTEEPVSSIAVASLGTPLLGSVQEKNSHAHCVMLTSKLPTASCMYSAATPENVVRSNLRLVAMTLRA